MLLLLISNIDYLLQEWMICFNVLLLWQHLKNEERENERTKYLNKHFEFLYDDIYIMSLLFRILYALVFIIWIFKYKN